MAVVLVADDDFGALEALASALVAAGHRVLRAGDGADALRILSRERVELVICDELMPGMSGPALIAAIRADARLAHLPAILRTVPTTIEALVAEVARLVPKG